MGGFPACYCISSNCDWEYLETCIEALTIPKSAEQTFRKLREILGNGVLSPLQRYV